MVHYNTIHRYDFLTKELLEKEYLHNGLTDKQIADKYHMPSKVTVWRKRKEYGINNKNTNKSNQNASKNRKFHIEREIALSFLAQRKTFKEIANYMGCSIIVAKRRFKELGLTRKQEQGKHYAYYDVILNHSQKQLLTGSILGDGNITISNAYGCTHSVKQSEYFFYKIEKLASIVNGYKFHHTRGTSPSGTKTKGLRFTTGTHRFCEELRRIFYLNGEKIVPYNYLKDNLEAEGLAYWYMDDGSYHIRSKNARLHTEGFDNDSVKAIQRFFMDKFNLDVRLHGKNYLSRKRYCCCFTRESTDRFIDIVKPFIAPCMMYKTGDTDAYLKWKVNQ